MAGRFGCDSIRKSGATENSGTSMMVMTGKQVTSENAVMTGKQVTTSMNEVIAAKDSGKQVTREEAW